MDSVRRGRGKISDRSMAWTEMNVYITNVPEEILATKQIYDVYSLRWQIGAPVKAS